MMTYKTVSPRRWLLLPLEIKAREFESRVMLACNAAAKGFGVLLGRNGFNLNGQYPQGVYLDKCLSPQKITSLTTQDHILGNKIASLDVEGLVYQSEEKWLRIRISEETARLSSLIFTWGEEQANMISNHHDIQGKIVITGSPSADLWHKRMQFLYEKKAAELRSRFDDYILIPSNFATVINANGSDFIVKQFVKNGFVTTEKEKDVLLESLDFHQKVFDKFVEMVPRVAEDNPGLNVILRPHPGDNINKWNQLSEKWPDNIKVLYEGSVTPWILGSKLLIHNSCSTAVEAFTMEKPIVAYMPYVDERFDQNIPNPLSQQAETIDDVLALVTANLADPNLGRDVEKTQLYSRHIKLDQKEFSTERMICALDRLDLPKVEYSFSPVGALKRMRISARKAKRRAKDLLGKNEFSYAYRQQKNPGIKSQEIEILMQSFQKNLNLWHDIQVDEVEEDVFCFYSGK